MEVLYINNINEINSLLLLQLPKSKIIRILCQCISYAYICYVLDDTLSISENKESQTNFDNEVANVIENIELKQALDPADFDVEPYNITLQKGETASFYLHSKNALEPKSCYWNMPDYGTKKCSLFIQISDTAEKTLPDTCSAMNDTRYIFIICIFLD